MRSTALRPSHRGRGSPQHFAYHAGIAAEADKEAASNRAAAVKIKAEADRVAFEVEATASG